MLAAMVVFSKWRETAHAVTLHLGLLASPSAEASLPCSAVHGPSCRSEQRGQRDTPRRGAQRSRCPTSAWLRWRQGLTNTDYKV
jgi:hypothetical protein